MTLGGRVMFVGVARNLLARIAGHMESRRLGKINFDDASVLGAFESYDEALRSRNAYAAFNSL